MDNLRFEELQQTSALLNEFLAKDLTPLDDVVALRPEGGRIPNGRNANETIAKISVKVGKANAIRHFREAGWLLVDKSELKSTRASIRKLVAESKVRRVLEAPDRSIRIQTKRCVLQRENERMENPHVHIERQLRFGENLFEASLSEDLPWDGVLETIQQSRNASFIEPVLLQHIDGRQSSRQWFHRNTGVGGGAVGADIRTVEAWEISKGRNVNVAVIDLGMQIDHMAFNGACRSGGYFNADGAFLPSNEGGFPDMDHGTHCLGMVGARHPEQRALGSAPECGLIPIACFPDHVGSQITLARAIAYAANPGFEEDEPSSGADVISCSLGPNSGRWEMTRGLRLAIDYARTQGRQGKGCPVFWAVANETVPIAWDRVCSYAGTIAVGRSNRLDLENGSAYGPELDFLAPGVEVYSTRSRNRYNEATGTSFAAPLAAGVAALVLSCSPELSAEQVRERLRTTCDKIGGPSVHYVDGRHDKYGSGRVNAFQAVR